MHNSVHLDNIGCSGPVIIVIITTKLDETWTGYGQVMSVCVPLLLLVVCLGLGKTLQCCGIACYGGWCLWQGHHMHPTDKGHLFILVVVVVAVVPIFVFQSKNTETCISHMSYRTLSELSVCLVNPCQMEICIKFNKGLLCHTWICSSAHVYGEYIRVVSK